jgi:hypothetical protein
VSDNEERSGFRQTLTLGRRPEDDDSTHNGNREACSLATDVSKTNKKSVISYLHHTIGIYQAAVEAGSI